MCAKGPIGPCLKEIGSDHIGPRRRVSCPIGHAMGEVPWTILVRGDGKKKMARTTPKDLDFGRGHAMSDRTWMEDPSAWLGPIRGELQGD